jgi:hypothetical protein
MPDDSDSEDMSYVVGRIYERLREKDGDPIRDLAHAISHLYSSIDALEEKIAMLSDRIEDIEADNG